MHGLLERLRRWTGESLSNRLSITAAIVCLVALLPATFLSFTYSARVARQDREARLSAQAEVHAQTLAQALSAAREGLADLAESDLLVPALRGDPGWQQFGVPFLRAHHLPLPFPTRLALLDARGQVLGSSLDVPAIAPFDWLPQVVGKGHWLAQVRGQPGDLRLLLVAPVRPAAGGEALGAVAADLPLADLAAGLRGHGLPLRLLDGGGRTLAGEPDGWAGRLGLARPLPLPEPFAALGLRVEAGEARAEAERFLALLAAGHVVAALLVLGLALLVARRLADRIAGPLRDLAASAWSISTTGALDTRVRVEGRDETALLAAAFNEMLGELAASRAAAEAALRSERREVEGALQLAYGAMERSGEAISIIEASGRIAYLNEAACRLLGLPREAVLGRPTWEVDPSLTEPRWQQLLSTVRSAGQYATERPRPAPDGPTRWIEVHLFPLQHGGTEYCVSVMRDVTARRQAEAALRLAGVGTLAAGAAHEINNPLTSIMGNLAFVLDGLGRLSSQVPAEGALEVEEARQAIGDAMQGAERVRDVVRGLKVFSRPDEEPQAATDVAQVMRSAVGLARNELRHLGRLVERYQEVPPILASGRRLEQVFVNLLVNAGHALGERAGDQHQVTVVVRPGAPGEVVAEVQDTGAGMAPEVRTRIFEPFFTTKPVGAGTGLGLAICHGIVASLGGRIEVESEPGRGSTFRVHLPALPPGAAVAGAPRPAAAEPPVHLPAGARLLIVDDDPLILSLLTRALAGGPEVVALLDAREALERLRQGERFDLLLCDLMMPELSGMDFHAALLAIDPALAGGAVFITGGAFTPRARAFLARVGNTCLEKPFDPQKLRRLVAARLGAVAIQPEARA